MAGEPKHEQTPRKAKSSKNSQRSPMKDMKEQDEPIQGLKELPGPVPCVVIPRNIEHLPEVQQLLRVSNIKENSQAHTPTSQLGISLKRPCSPSQGSVKKKRKLCRENPLLPLVALTPLDTIHVKNDTSPDLLNQNDETVALPQESLSVTQNSKKTFLCPQLYVVLQCLSESTDWQKVNDPLSTAKSVVVLVDGTPRRLYKSTRLLNDYSQQCEVPPRTSSQPLAKLGVPRISPNVTTLCTPATERHGCPTFDANTTSLLNTPVTSTCHEINLKKTSLIQKSWDVIPVIESPKQISLQDTNIMKQDPVTEEVSLEDSTSTSTSDDLTLIPEQPVEASCTSTNILVESQGHPNLGHNFDSSHTCQLPVDCETSKPMTVVLTSSPKICRPTSGIQVDNPKTPSEIGIPMKQVSSPTQHLYKGLKSPHKKQHVITPLEESIQFTTTCANVIDAKQKSSPTQILNDDSHTVLTPTNKIADRVAQKEQSNLNVPVTLTKSASTKCLTGKNGSTIHSKTTQDLGESLNSCVVGLSALDSEKKDTLYADQQPIVSDESQPPTYLVLSQFHTTLQSNATKSNPLECDLPTHKKVSLDLQLLFSDNNVPANSLTLLPEVDKMLHDENGSSMPLVTKFTTEQCKVSLKKISKSELKDQMNDRCAKTTLTTGKNDSSTRECSKAHVFVGKDTVCNEQLFTKSTQHDSKLPNESSLSDQEESAQSVPPLSSDYSSGVTDKLNYRIEIESGQCNTPPSAQGTASVTHKKSSKMGSSLVLSKPKSHAMKEHIPSAFKIPHLKNFSPAPKSTVVKKKLGHLSTRKVSDPPVSVKKSKDCSRKRSHPTSPHSSSHRKKKEIIVDASNKVPFCRPSEETRDKAAKNLQAKVQNPAPQDHEEDDDTISLFAESDIFGEELSFNHSNSTFHNYQHIPTSLCDKEQNERFNNNNNINSDSRELPEHYQIAFHSNEPFPGLTTEASSQQEPYRGEEYDEMEERGGYRRMSIERPVNHNRKPLGAMVQTGPSNNIITPPNGELNPVTQIMCNVRPDMERRFRNTCFQYLTLGKCNPTRGRPCQFLHKVPDLMMNDCEEMLQFLCFTKEHGYKFIANQVVRKLCENLYQNRSLYKGPMWNVMQMVLTESRQHIDMILTFALRKCEEGDEYYNFLDLLLDSMFFKLDGAHARWPELLTIKEYEFPINIIENLMIQCLYMADPDVLIHNVCQIFPGLSPTSLHKIESQLMSKFQNKINELHLFTERHKLHTLLQATTFQEVSPSLGDHSMDVSRSLENQANSSSLPSEDLYFGRMEFSSEQQPHTVRDFNRPTAIPTLSIQNVANSSPFQPRNVQFGINHDLDFKISVPSSSHLQETQDSLNSVNNESCLFNHSCSPSQEEHSLNTCMSSVAPTNFLPQFPPSLINHLVPWQNPLVNQNHKGGHFQPQCHSFANNMAIDNTPSASELPVDSWSKNHWPKQSLFGFTRKPQFEANIPFLPSSVGNGRFLSSASSFCKNEPRSPNPCLQNRTDSNVQIQGSSLDPSFLIAPRLYPYPPLLESPSINPTTDIGESQTYDPGFLNDRQLVMDALEYSRLGDLVSILYKWNGSPCVMHLAEVMLLHWFKPEMKESDALFKKLVHQAVHGNSGTVSFGPEMKDVLSCIGINLILDLLSKADVWAPCYEIVMAMLRNDIKLYTPKILKPKTGISMARQVLMCSEIFLNTGQLDKAMELLEDNGLFYPDQEQWKIESREEDISLRIEHSERLLEKIISSSDHCLALAMFKNIYNAQESISLPIDLMMSINGIFLLLLNKNRRRDAISMCEHISDVEYLSLHVTRGLVVLLLWHQLHSPAKELYKKATLVHFYPALHVGLPLTITVVSYWVNEEILLVVGEFLAELSAKLLPESPCLERPRKLDIRFCIQIKQIVNDLEAETIPTSLVDVDYSLNAVKRRILSALKTVTPPLSMIENDSDIIVDGRSVVTYIKHLQTTCNI